MFTAGTLRDWIGFEFPKLDGVVGERHRNYRREDTEGAHNASLGFTLERLKS